MRGLTVAEADELRRTPGATVVLFLTDRCPVRCAHCSVSSMVDSPTITDRALFAELVAGIAALPGLRAVAITGGEPFVERRGLVHAVSGLADTGIAVVLFTSGFWGRPVTPPWIHAVLERTSTVYLSFDSHHAPRTRDRMTAAVAAIGAAGCHLVLQVLDEPGGVEQARALSPTAEIRVIPALPLGRGARVFARGPARPLADLGRCALLNSPTIRYDGRVTACCHEAVIMGAGPAGLRRQVTGAADVGAALASLRQNPVLRLMGRFGPAALSTIVDGKYDSPCGPCWAAHERVEVDPVARLGASVLATAGGIS
jgi:hypothetical protein